jgi:hypothetical protein
MAVIVAGCRRGPGVGQDVPLDRVVEFDVENPHDFARPATNIAVSLADLAATAKEFSPSCLTLYDGLNEVPFQLDDIDQDGAPDVIAFQVTLEPKQRKRLELFYNAARSLLIRYPARAHAAVHPELEGPAWESDAIGFRLLLDARNAVGVFAKSEPVIAIERYAKSPDAGRTVESWGADACPIGETLGCGGFGFLKDGRVIRPRATPRKGDRPALRRFAQVIADGPVRAIVRLTYDGWVVDGEPRTVRATMTIWSGRRWATCDLEVGAGWRPPVAIGFAGSKGIPLVRKKDYCYTFGDQSIPMSDTRKRETLGMGLLFRQEHFASIVDEARAADAGNADDFSRAVILTPDAEGRVKWAYVAAWGRGKLGVRDAAEFEELCDSAYKDLSAPVLVHFRMRRR